MEYRAFGKGSKCHFSELQEKLGLLETVKFQLEKEGKENIQSLRIYEIYWLWEWEIESIQDCIEPSAGEGLYGDG